MFKNIHKNKCLTKKKKKIIINTRIPDVSYLKFLKNIVPLYLYLYFYMCILATCMLRANVHEPFFYELQDPSP